MSSIAAFRHVAIGSRTVVFSTTVVAKGGEDIVIRPFSDNPEIKLLFRVAFSNAITETRTSASYKEEEDSFVIFLESNWSVVNRSGLSITESFATNQDPNEDYFIDYFFEAIGSQERYLIRLTLTVFAGPSSS